jgi:hypothetical protein
MEINSNRFIKKYFKHIGPTETKKLSEGLEEYIRNQLKNNIMKTNNLTPGTGMSTETSNAEERKEIWDLLDKSEQLICNDNNYGDGLNVSTFENRILVRGNKQWFMPSFGGRHFDCITNPLTYAQMKALILGDTSKMPFKAACEAIKHGSHQLHLDKSGEVSAAEILNESNLYFSSGTSIGDYLYKINDCTKYQKDKPFPGVPIIKLSEIMPKEGKLNPCALCTYETSSRGENALVQLCDYHNNNEVKITFDITVEEKPVELEVGKWYKTPANGLYMIKSLISDKKFNCYGFNPDGCWVELPVKLKEAKKDVLATTSEITEALKNEAIKRGLVEGAWAKVGHVGTLVKLPNDLYEYDDENFFMLGDKVLMYDGIWATPIPALTRKEAEEKLSVKIID